MPARDRLLCSLSAIAYEFVDAVGGSVLERALSATSLGDYASVYLAFLYDVDPTPVEVIETLKRALARSD